MRSFLIFFLFLGASSAIIAQTSEPVLPPLPADSPSSEGWGAWFVEVWTAVRPHFTKELAGVIIGFITLLSGVFLTFFQRKLKRLRKRNDDLGSENRALTTRLADPLLSRLPEIETRALNVLFVGIGGSGKTSLVHALSASKDAKPSVATAENHLFSVAHEVNIATPSLEPHRQLVRFFLSDHVGQNFNSIKNTDFYRNPVLQSLPKCLVVVVDLQTPLINSAKNVVDRDSVEVRAQQHIHTYNSQLVQLLTGDLGKGSHIIIFINKMDVLPNTDHDARTEVMEIFSALIDSFSRVRGADVRVVCGSANTGLGINACTLQPNGFMLPNLYQSLREASVKVAG